MALRLSDRGRDQTRLRSHGLLRARPKVAKTLPKALPADLVAALLAALSSESEPRRRSEWTKRDRALILTGLRADEMLRANVCG